MEKNWIQKKDHICKQNENCDFCEEEDYKINDKTSREQEAYFRHNCTKFKEECEFCYAFILAEAKKQLAEKYENGLENATFLLNVEQLSTLRYYPAEIVLRAEESDIHDYRKGNRREWDTSSPRVHTFRKPDQVRNPQETLPSNPLGESERKCRAEQDLLFKGTRFLRNGYMSEERWECFKRIMEGDSVSRGIWELGLSKERVSQSMGDNERKANV